MLAAQNMDMNVVYGLTAFHAIVQNQAVTFVQSAVFGDLSGHQHAMSKKLKSMNSSSQFEFCLDRSFEKLENLNFGGLENIIR